MNESKQVIRGRLAVSAVMSLLAPIGVSFWWSFLTGVDIHDFLCVLLVVSFYGAIPFFLSWALGFLPFVVRGKDIPSVQGVFKLTLITTCIGMIWGSLIALIFEAPVMLAAMTLAGIGPGLGYGLWLNVRLRAIA